MNLSTASHSAYAKFRADLDNYAALNVRHETGIRSAFQIYLQTLSAQSGLTLVPEQNVEGTRIRPDGTLRDGYNLPRGYWESKDTNDDLEAEIGKKKRKGYPFTNILFEDTQKAVLFQNNRRVYDADLADANQTATLLSTFLAYQEPDPTSFDNAMVRFGAVIPALANGLIDRICKERKESLAFADAFDSLFALCRDTLNPQIQPAVVVEMLAQHLLTERLFRTIFDNPDFVRRNVIAQKVEETINVMMSRSFNRGDFTQTLDKYYYPIENKARESSGWEQKQTFLNTLYERFFQDFSKKAADTQGIVYTPQPIVNFMLESVDALLVSEFGTSLSDKGVVVLDPCVGTGNFMQNLLRRISPLNLKHKYENELFCNENMLLPYYIASLNLEHAFYEKAGVYQAFPGLCFTDTLMLENGFVGGASGRLDYFSEENAERVKAQQAASVTVIIGNPPYNAGQKNENDNNKNRVYEQSRKRIKETYVKHSGAKLSTKAYDPYCQFFRWATDRLGDRDGIIAYVSNNAFVTDDSLDGIRKCFADEFTAIYHVDLGGNWRKNGGGNVFGIGVGVGITFLVRSGTRVKAEIRYHCVEKSLKGNEKLVAVSQLGKLDAVNWQTITPDARSHWLNEDIQDEYNTFLSMGSPEAKAGKKSHTVFQTYSLGISTNRNEVAYNFDKRRLESDVRDFIRNYNAEVQRHINEGKPKNVDDFVDYSRVKWSRNLKRELYRGKLVAYNETNLRRAIFRPFCSKCLYLADVVVDERGTVDRAFPNLQSEADNVAIWIKQGNSEVPYALAINGLPDLMPNGGSQCFPFYTYDADGTNRRENITDDALHAFRTHYADAPDLTKQDIFAYIYALLHHPDYRNRYRENLKRELPRIPLAGDLDTFRALSEAGSKLILLHTGYETAPEYPLKDEYDAQATLADIFRVEKMRLNKEKTALVMNPHLTLSGIPPETHEYKLGSRSALDWIIDQYRVRENSNAKSEFCSDPNRADEPDYIVHLVKRIVTVSVETVRIISALPPLGLGGK